MEVHRGEVFYADLSPVGGTAPGGQGGVQTESSALRFAVHPPDEGGGVGAGEAFFQMCDGAQVAADAVEHGGAPFSAKAAQTGRQPARRTTEILGRLCKFGVFILKFPLNSCTIGVVIPKGVCSVSGETAIFSIHDKKDYEIHEIVQQVYDALKEKGYNPVNQLVGYILSEDPTYITTYKNARSMIRKVDRDDLLQAMLRSYLNV